MHSKTYLLIQKKFCKVWIISHQGVWLKLVTFWISLDKTMMFTGNIQEKRKHFDNFHEYCCDIWIFLNCQIRKLNKVVQIVKKLYNADKITQFYRQNKGLFRNQLTHLKHWKTKDKAYPCWIFNWDQCFLSAEMMIQSFTPCEKC